MNSAPVAIVGASWRSANTSVRAQLANWPGAREALTALRDAGYLQGAACIATCSRTEWVLTSSQAEWAGALFRGALAARSREFAPDALQLRSGPAALHYLLRVAVGLDSVAEGEGAVGRQVLTAFAGARKDGHSDPLLNRVGKAVERLIHARRLVVPASRSLGVQALVREALKEHGVKRVAILGRGEFGLAMERSLRAISDWELTTWTRATLAQLLERLSSIRSADESAGGIDALVICTGGPQPWLTLPEGRGLCIDAGAPPQVREAAGWSLIGLDALLSRRDLQLTEEERTRLAALVATSATELAAELESPAPATALAAIDAERAAFLNEQLPPLLAKLAPKDARRVRQAVSAFTHRLILKTREAS